MRFAPSAGDKDHAHDCCLGSKIAGGECLRLPVERPECYPERALDPDGVYGLKTRREAKIQDQKDRI
jgi:hypothetical protein